MLSSPRTTRIAVGKRLRVTLDEGWYLYVGSAFGPGGLDARLRRHQRGDGRRHWHVDYLRAATTFVGAIIERGNERREHQWAAELEACGEYATIPGFGCTDCRCTTHLFHAAAVPASLPNLLSGAPRWWHPPATLESMRLPHLTHPDLDFYVTLHERDGHYMATADLGEDSRDVGVGIRHRRR